MNRTRTIVNLLVVLAFAFCTFSAQGASKVSSRKAKSFIKQLEKEHQASWEQMKEKFSSRQEIWIQPENKDVECKVVYVVSDESGLQIASNAKFYWDGECKDGYAKGLGRSFMDSTSGLVAWLEEYSEPGKPPKSYYVHGYDNKSTVEGFGDGSEPNRFAMNGNTWQLSDDISNPNFHVRQSYFDSESGYSFLQASNSSNDVVIRVFAFSNKKAVVFKTFLDPTERTARWAHFGDENGTPIGYGIAVGRDGQVVHSAYKNGVRSTVTLPRELVEYFIRLETEIASKLNLAESERRKGSLALEVYKRRTCSGELNVDFMDNILYGQICLEHGDFTPYIDKIEDLQISAQERLGRKTQLASNQAQIDANRRAALAQQQRAQQAQEWEYAQRAIADAQRQSQQFFNNSMNGLNNFSLPGFVPFGGNSSSGRNTSVCHVIGNIVTCN